MGYSKEWYEKTEKEMTFWNKVQRWWYYHSIEIQTVGAVVGLLAISAAIIIPVYYFARGQELKEIETKNKNIAIINSCKDATMEYKTLIKTKKLLKATNQEVEKKEIELLEKIDKWCTKLKEIKL